MNGTIEQPWSAVNPDIVTLVNVCGGYNEAVRVVTAVSRSLWNYIFAGLHGTLKGKSARRQSSYRPIPEQELRNVLGECIEADLVSPLINGLVKAGVYERDQATSKLKAQAFNPRGLARSILGGYRTDADLRYAVMRAIRLHYSLPLSLATVHYFGQMAQEVTALIESARLGKKRTTKADFVGVGIERIKTWQSDFVNGIVAELALKDDEPTVFAARALHACFFEACRALGYLSVSGAVDEVQFRTANIDCEFIVSHLFGVPTNISGLDPLFGGGGLVLPEVTDRPESDPLGLWRERLPARIMVVSGARGTGKSILASQLASEIAMRGGVSWFMPLEQSPEECVFTLESMGSLRSTSASVSTKFASAATALDNWSDNNGALLILKPEDRDSSESLECLENPEEEYEELGRFLTIVSGTADSLSCGNVRLVVIDPLNSRVPGPNNSVDTVRLRGMLRRAIQSFKKSGTNVLLVVEEHTGAAGRHSETEQPMNELEFAENLADIIIRLSIKTRHNYATRYLEIRKSRTQREQRGDHVFAIRSNQGISIVPSVASFHARFRKRQLSKRVEPLSFGLRCVDDVLGRGTLYRGDVVVLTGEPGTYKTQLGLPFLLARDNGKIGLKEGCVSLLFSTRENIGTTHSFLENMRLDSHRSAAPGKSVDDETLCIVPIPVGHIPPERILQIIGEEVEKIELRGKKLHRIMIDNIGLWETCSPAVSDDSTFAITLVEFLRTQRRTCLLVCGVPWKEGPSLQRSLIGLSDCLINLEKYEFRGISRVMMRVLKSHGMSHRRDAFEVSLENGKFSMWPSTSLLRRNPNGGGLVPIPIRLLFHTESELQRSYFAALRDSLRVVASPDTKLEIQDRVALSHAMGMGGISAVDELQVLEMDEFQFGAAFKTKTNAVSLQTFQIEHGAGRQLEDVFPRYSHNCQLKGYNAAGRPSDRYRAVPFFANVGLLAFDQGEMGEADLRDWKDIAEKCWKWEKAKAQRDMVRRQTEGQDTSVEEAELFFEHPRGSGENFNCLFFEIMLSLPNLPSIREGECAFRKWLSSPQATQAAALLRILCRRAYQIADGRLDSINWQAGLMKSRSDDEETDEEKNKNVFRVNHRAIVYRHWYTTLNEMLREMSSPRDGKNTDDSKAFQNESRKRLDRIAVKTLPKHIAVSGEWYLGIPSHSAAADTGVKLIEGMTTPDAELTRVRLGVGLPTRQAYYETSKRSRRLAISPFFDMDTTSAKCLVVNAFSRTNFQCYEQASQTLAHHLKRLVEAPSDEESDFTQALLRASVLAKRSLQAACVELDFTQRKSDKQSKHVVNSYDCEYVNACRNRVRDGLKKITTAKKMDRNRNSSLKSSS